MSIGKMLACVVLVSAGPAMAQPWLYQQGPGGTPPAMYTVPTWQSAPAPLPQFQWIGPATDAPPYALPPYGSAEPFYGGPMRPGRVTMPGVDDN
jgi:hypothetical protein